MDKEIREALETIRKHGYPADSKVYSAFMTISKVLERYLEASEELPKKMKVKEESFTSGIPGQDQYQHAYNQAIDDCTLAHLKAKEKWDKLVDKNSDEIAEYIEACVDSKVSQNYVAKDKLPDIYELAKFMHEEYENSARLFGWESQEKCRVPFNELPEANMKTMLSVATAIKERLGG